MNFLIVSLSCVWMLLTDMSGYLLAISTSPDSADAFGEYLVENTDLEYLFVGGEYTSDFIGGLYEI